MSVKKIIWLCNMAPGEIRAVTGGADRGALWMDHVFQDLRKQGFKIQVLYASAALQEGKLDEQCGYTAYQEGLPYVYMPELEDQFGKILKKTDPDIIHIWGTEYGHTLAMVNAAEKTGYLDRVVISIQGLCSVIAKHYMEGIPVAVQKKNTFRDFVKKNSLKDQKRYFELRGKAEVEALKKVHHVIGRTDWDEACTKAVNPDVQYHFCNETLRTEFYEGCWQYKNCQKHRVFTSSAEYPVKGFHYLLEAMGIVREHFPDATVSFAGLTPFPKKDRFGKLRTSVYSGYLDNLVKKYNLEDCLHSAGFLNADAMKQEFLQCNVFVMPSTIENSPNSLGEAMLLGVPCVASNVGGVTNLLHHKKDGFVYQSTAPYMLAYYIMELFAMQDAAEKMGLAARQSAVMTHSPERNLEKLLDIYKIVSNERR